MSYTISLDVTGESLDEVMAAIETTLEHQLAPLAEDGSLDEQIAAENGEMILGVTGDRADLTAMLAKADDDGDGESRPNLSVLELMGAGGDDESKLGLGLDDDETDDTQELAAVAVAEPALPL